MKLKFRKSQERRKQTKNVGHEIFFNSKSNPEYKESKYKYINQINII